MATSADDIKKEYPIPSWKYEVTFDDTEMGFSEVSGLAITHETITYRDGKVTQHMPGMGSPVELSLKRGIVKDKKELMEWITAIEMNTIDKKDVSISLLDEKNENPLVTWKVLNAFPKKLDAPSFNASNNEVAIESLDLMGDKLEIEYK